ncbi:putative late embryogenesis abundant protein-like [Capsicum annuum]|nr:putative late embryogenesis abundant protein-like [Capsicum annuum]
MELVDQSESSPLVPPPSVITDPSEIDLEAGSGEQIQCRICLETDGYEEIDDDGYTSYLSGVVEMEALIRCLVWYVKRRSTNAPVRRERLTIVAVRRDRGRPKKSLGRDFIAPCKCKGTSKFVHRECLDHWRAVKEGFAFSHCTTCKAPYYLRVHVPTDRKWRTLKFRFFVTRDILFIFVAVQLVIASLGYLVYLIDTYHKSWLRLTWGFDSELSFYYLCGKNLELSSSYVFVKS